MPKVYCLIRGSVSVQSFNLIGFLFYAQDNILDIVKIKQLNKSKAIMEIFTKRSGGKKC